MPRRVSGQENIRKLGKTGSSQSPSYFITLPISYVRQLGWRDGQKLVIEYNEDSQSLTLHDEK